MHSRSKRDYLRVGVTGGIGAGKSTVCHMFRSLGRTVLEADAIARALMHEDPDCRRAIEQAFGEDSYLPTGELNKQKIGEIVFGSVASRKKLNAIVHPRVIDHIIQALKSLPRMTRAPYTLIEAALVFESGMEDDLDYTVAVHADDELRIRRIMARDHVGRDDVVRKLAAQMPPSVQARKADFVLENNDGEGELRTAVQFLDHLLSQIPPRSE